MTTDIRAAIAAERTDLIELLADLPEHHWDSPSLCAGWRVREVVAHITMAYRYPLPRFLFHLARSGGNFTRMSDNRAKADAASLSTKDLLASLRDNVNHPWKPPGDGYEGALSHDVVHGLDITVALGVDRKVPLDRLRAVLGGMTGKKAKYFGVDLDGVQLRATDLDWTLGSGTPRSAPAQDLLLFVCGREI
ncbi:maleylpyruvate isomerase family mycothiol-dependent enzyme [Allokutzneria sp. NRRL B-24872]|uniref:maleylpyruvate isomerase family mycothiol-dependent enzyme n=1 Tax=Allokutzneria sp. NRRL B-24872 TaxID=1137961 RepID=UPI000A383BF7|nr:maleylpyruvate isomerase family mycothiol-dependent enzyme [Allokutzneria sp. NRRL B-24872]